MLESYQARFTGSTVCVFGSPSSPEPCSHKVTPGMRFAPVPRRSERVFSPRVQNTRPLLWTRYRASRAESISREIGPCSPAGNLRTLVG